MVFGTKDLSGKMISIEHPITNYLGLSNVTGKQMAEAFTKQMEEAGIEITDQRITAVYAMGDFFGLQTSDNQMIEASSVILCTGVTAGNPYKGETQFLGRGVSYCATCDGPLLKNKVAAIYGNGDRVLEEGLYLANIVKRLYLLCPNETYQGDEALLEKLKEKDNVTYLPSSKILSIQGDFRVTSIRYSSKEEEHVLETNMVFPFAGEKSAVQFLSTLPVIMEKGFIVVDDKNMSNIPGLFAAGDIVKKRLRQVVTAASDGAIASTGILSYLHSLKRNVK